LEAEFKVSDDGAVLLRQTGKHDGPDTVP
jgi:hypothetical protein